MVGDVVQTRSWHHVALCVLSVLLCLHFCVGMSIWAALFWRLWPQMLLADVFHDCMTCVLLLSLSFVSVVCALARQKATWCLIGWIVIVSALTFYYDASRSRWTLSSGIQGKAGIGEVEHYRINATWWWY